MSWSLRLHNGDLVLGQSSYDTVTVEDKMVQDLRCYILEQMGTDDMHPGFGSVIQGGITPSGDYNPGVIGTVNDDLAHTFVDSEMRRLVRDYQERQLARAKEDKVTYGKVTLTKGEVVAGLSRVDIEQTLDSMNVNLVIVTAASTILELPMEFTI